MARNFILPTVHAKGDKPQKRVDRRRRIDVKEREKRTFPVSSRVAFMVISKAQFLAVAPARTVTVFRRVLDQDSQQDLGCHRRPGAHQALERR